MLLAITSRLVTASTSGPACDSEVILKLGECAGGGGTQDDD